MRAITVAMILFALIIPAYTHADGSGEIHVLVTGFKPFGNYSINPSQLVAENLSGEIVEGARIVGIVLPVEWNESCEIVMDAIERYNPEIIISMGLSPRARELELEKIAVNLRWVEDFPFISTIHRGSRLIRMTDVNVHKLVGMLEDKGIPSKVSYFAGLYICNNLFYNLLEYKSKNNPEMKVVFIHVPPLEYLSLEEMMEGVRLVISYLL